MGGPFLDVSDVVCDPMIADTFTVLRRAENVDGFGRSAQIVETFNNIVGVITSAGPNDLERLDDQQRMGNHIVVVTKFRLRGPALDGEQNYQPDVVVWAGDEYVVEQLNSYARFGAGFMQAICGSMDSIDVVAEEPNG